MTGTEEGSVVVTHLPLGQVACAPFRCRQVERSPGATLGHPELALRLSVTEEGTPLGEFQFAEWHDNAQRLPDLDAFADRVRQAVEAQGGSGRKFLFFRTTPEAEPYLKADGVRGYFVFSIISGGVEVR